MLNELWLSIGDSFLSVPPACATSSFPHPRGRWGSMSGVPLPSEPLPIVTIRKTTSSGRVRVTMKTLNSSRCRKLLLRAAPLRFGAAVPVGPVIVAARFVAEARRRIFPAPAAGPRCVGFTLKLLSGLDVVV